MMAPKLHTRVAAAVLLGAWLVRPAPTHSQAADSGRVASTSTLSAIHHRRRAKRTRSAQAEPATVLQLEVGYDGNFRAPDLVRDQAATVTTVVTPTPRVELQIDIDVWMSQRAPRQRSMYGRGDAHLAAQWTLRTGRPGQVAIGLVYDVKLPTARPDSLGTGRVDHRLLSLVSVSSRRLQIDAALGVAADAKAVGLAWGTEGALTLTGIAAPTLSFHVGGSGQTIDTDQPAGAYISAGAAWQVTPVFAFDFGGRLGLSPNAPVYGVVAGLTVPMLRR
jgi:hypothetical protein